MLSFKSFFERLKATTDINSQFDLAKALGINRSAITQAKSRQVVPQSWILPLCRRYSLNPDWLQMGQGQPQMPRDYSEASILHNQSANIKVTSAASVRSTTVKAEKKNQTAECVLNNRKNTPHTDAGPMYLVPKVSARLCAGIEAWEIETLPVGEFPFPTQWLSRMGNPRSMVLMDVMGDSMEPGILDGDTVMIDQSRQVPGKGIWAVSMGDTIMIKRLESHKDGSVTLKCDNADYGTEVLSAEKLKNLKIIGKVIWMSRDCRWF